MLPYNLSIIHPDNISTFIVRFDVDECHINCKEHGSGSAATTEHPDKMPEHKLTEVLLHAFFFFFFTIHSLNLYIFNDHITVSLNINYAWGNCYLVHITLTQTPVWESRCKDEFL